MGLDFSHPQVMGILNVTPDSFSDGGCFTAIDKALRHVERMVVDGVAIVDVGGESTRPGAQSVSVDDELARVVPLVEVIRSNFDIPISVDTSKPVVMSAAIGAGANMLNDVYALRNDGAVAVAASLNVPVCLMHMQGEPRTMQKAPKYIDVVDDVIEFLSARVMACMDGGITREHLIVDPGFGFGKSLAHNLSMLKRLTEFEALGLPLLVGISRKTMIGEVLGKSVEERLSGSLAAVTLAVWQGAKIIRTHDVAETVDVVKLATAVKYEGTGST